jgi:predicted nucleic acid-binding protein
MIFMTEADAPWSLDSNIFLYAIDSSDLRKKSIALRLWEQSALAKNVLPTQVVGEVFRAARTRFGLTGLAALAFTSELSNYHRMAPATQPTFEQAMSESARTNRQFWDCLIIATCAEHGVKTLYTEDTAGQPHTVLGVKLVNPFV